MAYSGLETLFQNMGPTYAASVAGQREGIAQGMDQISAATQQQALLKAQQDYDQADKMNPLNAQYRQGEVASQAAQLPGLVGLSQQHVSKGKVDHDTEEQKIITAIQDGKLKVDEAHLKQQETLGAMAGNLGQILKSQPEQYHEDTRRRFMETNKIDPNSSSGQAVMNTAPDELIDTANRISDMNSKMRQAQLEASASIVKGADHNDTLRRIAGVKADASTAVAASREKSFVSELLKSPPKTRSGAVASILKSGISPETNTELTEAEKQFYQTMLDRDTQVVNAELASRAGEGMIVSVGPNGKAGITNRTPPTVGDKKPAPRAVPALPPGWTNK